ncbi:MAG: serine/threonine-protein kinase [Streptosporangiaceae bacterium]|jgi:serine/threonine protein kinase
MALSQSETEALRPWDPEMIGSYVVLGRLGAGSMGQVYLGRSPAGRLVAVKTIKVELAEEAGFRTRFSQEVAAARKVSGVFTAAVVEADPDADLPWLATAYVPAPTLSRMIQVCGPLPVRTVNWLAAGCAEALESIHGAGLVHQDLKPSNVLVAPDGPRVIDFGVARAAGRMELTASRGAVGTPAYMAPEQARDPHQASVASDVYALGATLLFAATGHPPYLGASVLDVLARLATEEPDLSGLPAELTSLITACLHRVPRERPTSSAVLAQLGQFTEAQAYGPGSAHAYLPEPAMLLIGEYQRSPQLVGLTSRAPGEDSTAASFTELPAGYKPPRRREAQRGPRETRRSREPRETRGRRGAIGAIGAIGADWQRWLGGRLAWIGWIAVGAALVVGGVVLGASLTSSSAPPPAADRPQPPPSCASSGPSGSSLPSICLVQATGDFDATFVVRGTGFAPGVPVTVSMSGVGPPPDGAKIMGATAATKPVAGPDGTFSLTVNRLFPGPYQPGLYTVVVTGPGGAQASADFMVIPAGAPPP